VELTQVAEAETESLSSRWGSLLETPDGFAVSDDTTEFEVTLPSQLTDHFGGAWAYRFGGVNGWPPATGTVNDSGGVLVVPAGRSLLGESTMVLSLAGAHPETAQLSMFVVLSIRSDLTGTTASIALTRDTADEFSHSIYTTVDQTGIVVSPGSVITVASRPGTWTVGPDGDWPAGAPVVVQLLRSDQRQILAEFPAEVEEDGSALTMQIPSVPDLEDVPYLPNGAASRTVELTVRITEPAVAHDPVRAGTVYLHTPLTLVPASSPAIDRIAGADRYEAAIAVSREAFPTGARVAFVVTGENYPDALSAGPAAVHLGGPLLLTRRSALPAGLGEELSRLDPDDVYIVGGAASVSDGVLDEIRSTGAVVHRFGGADRYEVSRMLAEAVFGREGRNPSSSGLVYIATGRNFPDALAAGGAAGHAGSPVLLVDGAAPRLDAATRSQLTSLGATRVTVAGGPASVSDGIESDLGRLAPTTRLWGADRYDAAAAINLDAYGPSDRAFVVTGSTFPDALAGSAWAGRLGAPLYVSRPDCVPGSMADAAARQDVSRLTLIGGPASLSSGVGAFTLCVR
jgi:putative cell wall-binding protein